MVTKYLASRERERPEWFGVFLRSLTLPARNVTC